MSEIINDPQQILENVFGYKQFRDLQKKTIDAVLRGENVLLLMPTGGGKSLCYQIPSLCLKGVCIVVSPLIALMQDQVSGLSTYGIRAATLNSSGYSRNATIYSALRKGEIDLLYVSPEKLLSEDFVSFLKTIDICLFAIDEAHCISQWGHDFRPPYRQLCDLVSLFPSVPRLALTATADKNTRTDILRLLSIDTDNMFVSSFDRPNLFYDVKIKDNERKQLLTFLNDHKDESGIVYCATKNKVDETCTFLEQNGFCVRRYHAGIDYSERQEAQSFFIHAENVIMVATIAFGMGINKTNVRFVVHLDLPQNIETYYQETGRAGRDGLPSSTLLLYGARDIVLRRSFIELSDTGEEYKRLAHKKLNALLGYVETAQCRRKVLLDYFGEKYEVPCDNCDNCVSPPETYDAQQDMLKFLSCVYRVRERSGFSFGAGHIIDVLCGKETEKIKKFGHDTLSTFGIGKETPEYLWKTIYRQALISEFVLSDDQHSTLELTPEGRSFCKNPYEILLRKTAVKMIKKKKEKTATENLSDQNLFSALKELRLTIAREENVPAFYIFSDKSLIDMANKKPYSLDEFSRIFGVGQTKLEKYGADFVLFIQEYMEQNEET